MRMEDMVLLHEAGDLEGDKRITGAYGPHLLMDCHGCDVSTFNREHIKEFMHALCEAIEMDAKDFYFWDDEDVPEEQKQTLPHAKGSSMGGVFKKKVGIQFIITSSIVIHTLDLLGRVYIDIFSCKLFNEGKAKAVVYKWFRAGSIGSHLIQRN